MISESRRNTLAPAPSARVGDQVIRPSTSSSTEPVSTTTTTETSLLWPQAYAQLWGDRERTILSFLRSFRDEVLVQSDLGREYLDALYSNSSEIALMLILDHPLLVETREVIDELLPAIKSIRRGSRVSLTDENKARVVALLNHFEVKAMTPQLKQSLRNTVKGLRAERPFTQFGVVAD